MGPEQAVVAAQMLGAELAIPIHYDQIAQPGLYEQTENPAGAFTAAADELGVSARMLNVGETLEWP